MTAIKDMTPSELRIACAEKCGWKKIQNPTDQIYIVYESGYKRYWTPKFKNGEDIATDIPNYEYDRNDLHKLLLAVPEDKRSGFIDALIHNLDLDLQMFDSALEGNSWKGNVPKDLFTLLAADPLAIMRAFLEVMK